MLLWKLLKFSPFFALTLVNLYSLSARAEGGVSGGGGGNAVVCFGTHTEIPARIRSASERHSGVILDSDLKHITSVETYDLQQARLTRGWAGKAVEIVEIRPDESEEAYLDRLASHYDQTLPPIAELVRRANRIFLDQNITPQPSGLLKIDDAAELSAIDSAHCVLATMGANYYSGDPQGGGSFYLNYDRRLFLGPRHSAQSRAIFRLHEGLHALARVFGGAQTSQPTRDFVRHLITVDPNLSMSELWKATVDLGFQKVMLGMRSPVYGYFYGPGGKLVPYALSRLVKEIFDDLHRSKTTGHEADDNDFGTMMVSIKHPGQLHKTRSYYSERYQGENPEEYDGSRFEKDLVRMRMAMQVVSKYRATFRKSYEDRWQTRFALLAAGLPAWVVEEVNLAIEEKLSNLDKEISTTGKFSIQTFNFSRSNEPAELFREGAWDRILNEVPAAVRD